MNWTDLAGALTRVGAPSIGRMVAGPAGEKIGEAVGGILADVLDVPATPEAIGAVIETRRVARKPSA
ncbi:hypothetical protein [Mangrovicella endophytica]|uniref:hypothetical protein n=1 Tax=Mangrovicella endophytica TaxID=2066697 RepID=UPI000C9EA676|nr:hypothetical protein [Mangrovicella endophytica]